MKPYRTAILALTWATAISAQSSDIDMFPPPQPGLNRLVITMQPRDDEANWQVEFYAGKQLQIDCNRHSYGNNLEQRELQGWGYDYWIATDRNSMGTRMGCPPQSQRLAFVRGTPVTRPYSSRLPIVVYAPQGIEVRYRFWSVVEREWRAPRR